jgi:hypothetical protein
MWYEAAYAGYILPPVLFACAALNCAVIIRVRWYALR